MSTPNQQIETSRRRFLSLIGQAGLSAGLCRAVPLVGGMMATRNAHAQAAGVRRVVFVYVSNGAPRGLWLPQGNQLAPSTAAYEGLQSVCNFREVSVVSSGHGLARKCLGELRWSQDWTSDSIDQQIASVLGVDTPFRSFVFGVQTDSNNLISRRSGSSVAAQDDPAQAFQQLFGGAASDPGERDAERSRRRSVLDVHRSSLQALRSRLGSFEAQTLDAHEEAIQEVERRLNPSTPGGEPSQCGADWNQSGFPLNAQPFEHQANLQSDLIVAAFRCGLLPVATLQLGWHQGTWYGHDTAYRGDHHGSCHSAPAEANAEMTNYLSGCVAYLIRRLRETDDPLSPGQTLLDTTVVVQVTDMGDGRDHSGDAGPNLIATRMPSFRVGTVTRGGNNLQVLEAVVEGLGLSQYKGTNQDQHRIWPCAQGQVADGIVA